jgi:lysozyme
MISDNLIESIKIHEGFSSTVYRCTSGVQTIGWGRAVDPDEEGTGITEEEAEVLLKNDLERFEEFTKDVVGDTWHVLDQVRREALIEMCFNLGPGNLAKFRMMLACLAQEDFEGAADQAIASRWADQVGHRAVRIAGRIRTGSYD